MKRQLSRRELLLHSLAGFGAVSLPLSLTACSGGGGAGKGGHQAPVTVNFTHGVASGDPLQDRVILWTRATPVDPMAKPQVTWEIASDSQFRHIVNQGVVETSSLADFTVKIDANGLSPNQTYFYRFLSGGSTSPVGQTKTIPAVSSSPDQVRFAVCSCSNYPAGYFHVYREIANQNVDVVIHLGDYIYEYGKAGYGTESAEQLGRLFALDNENEIETLDDYRRRYALYRLDADLQAAHHRHPFIVIWDDHELSDDTWEKGVGDKNYKGNFSERKLAALQAYFEWMPIRPITENDRLKIYRQFDFGSLVKLSMLDTRIIARSQQLKYVNYLSSNILDMTRFKNDLNNRNRSILGLEQYRWLENQITQSNATWHVLGQQVLMTKMMIPSELISILTDFLKPPYSLSKFAELATKLVALSSIKTRLNLGDRTLSTADRNRVNIMAPFNLDAWDGYYTERENLYGLLSKLKKKVVVLAGDTHNSWSSDLFTDSGTQVGVELAISSISSPGMESYIERSLFSVKSFETAFTNLVKELNYANLSQRGYLLVNFTPERMQSDWIYVSTVKERKYSIDHERSHTVKIDKNFKHL